MCVCVCVLGSAEAVRVDAGHLGEGMMCEFFLGEVLQQVLLTHHANEVHA